MDSRYYSETEQFTICSPAAMLRVTDLQSTAYRLAGARPLRFVIYLKPKFGFGAFPINYPIFQSSRSLSALMTGNNRPKKPERFNVNPFQHTVELNRQ